MKNQKKAYGFALLSVLCWSTVATAFKISLADTNIYTFLLLSSGTAVGVLFIFTLVTKKVHLLSFEVKKYGGAALRGLFNPFLYYLVLFEAYRLLPAQEAQSLNYTWPVVLSIFAIIFFKEKFKWSNILALLLSFIGVLVISTHGNIFKLEFENARGSILAVGSSLIWAAYWVLNVKSKLDDMAKLFLNFFFGWVYILAITLIFHKFSMPDFIPAIGAVYSGIFEMGLTFILWLKAMQLATDTARVSNLIFLSPFLSLIFIRLIVGEQILPSTFGGLLLIVSGILIQQLKIRKSSREV